MDIVAQIRTSGLFEEVFSAPGEPPEGFAKGGRLLLTLKGELLGRDHTYYHYFASGQLCLDIPLGGIIRIANPKPKKEDPWFLYFRRNF